MATVARIPITNVFMGGDYTGQIFVGPNKQPMNVILDTGSSALALDGHKYHLGAGDQTTNLAQFDSYGDGSHWTGAVVNTDVAVGGNGSAVSVKGANVAVAYEQTANMFRGADGILGLAYSPLDDAFQMPKNTATTHYTGTQVRQGVQKTIAPYLTQLAGENVVSDKVSFYTNRSFVHEGGGGANDPLNKGWMIVGGGEEATDLYTGPFQTAKILADEWYNTNLKAILVGTVHIPVRARGPMGVPSNSIVDSGTNSLNLGPQLLKAVVAKFTASQQAMLNASIFEQRLVSAAELDLPSWPDLTFILQGDTGDVSLRVSPNDYWQVDTQTPGAALAAITPGQNHFAILGLPLMNGYFTVFDGEADGGKGVIKFATSKRPPLS